MPKRQQTAKQAGWHWKPSALARHLGQFQWQWQFPSSRDDNVKIAIVAALPPATQKSSSYFLYFRPPLPFAAFVYQFVYKFAFILTYLVASYASVIRQDQEEAAHVMLTSWQFIKTQCKHT